MLWRCGVSPVCSIPTPVTLPFSIYQVHYYHRTHAPSRLGLEGLATFKQDVDFDAENYAVTINGVRISVFDRVSVVIEVEKDKNTQRGKVKMTLAEPVSSAGL